MKKYCVYCHINKTNNKRYIGMTSQIPERRWSNGEGYKTCSVFYNAIKHYGWDGFEHIVYFTNLDKTTAERWEKVLIAHFKTTDRKYGYNLESGGACKILSEETKHKMSVAHRGVPCTETAKIKLREIHKGKTLSKEHCYKLSVAHKGKKQSIEQIEKRRQKLIGKKRSSALVEYMKQHSARNKKVAQYTLNGSFVAEYISGKDAARQLNIDNRGISACCTNKRATYKGYVWKFI